MELITGSWNRLQALAAPVRTRVFVHKQGVPQELEWDLEDLSALHAVIVDTSGRAVATGRLLNHAPGVGRIGRMAVLALHRQQGLGQRILSALMQAAFNRGDRRLVLHAQVSAQGFYARAGFKPHGPVFEEAGIDHIEMWSVLSDQMSSSKG